MSHFTPLAAKSYFSTDGGPRSPHDWCHAAQLLGYRALGIVERGPLASLPEFMRAAREYGIAPIFGIEVSVTLPLIEEEAEPARKGRKAEVPQDTAAPELRQPVLLYARGNGGLANLFALSRIAYSGWPRSERPISFFELEEHCAGLLAVLLPSTAERTTPLGSLRPKQLSELGATLHDIFGGLIFMGLPLPNAGDDSLTRQAQATAYYLGVPSAALPEIRHLKRDDRRIDAALTQIRQKSRTGSTYGSPENATALLLPPDEYTALYGEWSEALACTSHIADQCSGVDPIAYFAAQIGETDAWEAVASAAKSADVPILMSRLGRDAVHDMHNRQSDPAEDLSSDLTTVELEVSQAGLQCLLSELRTSHTVLFSACYVEASPAQALKAAAEVLEVPLGGVEYTGEQATVARVLEIARAKSQELADLVRALASLPVRFQPDRSTFVILKTADPKPLPLLDHGSNQEEWLPWLDRDLREFGLQTVGVKISPELTILERATELVRTALDFEPKLAGDALNHADANDLASLLMDTESAQLVPFWSPDLAAPLKTRVSSESNHEELVFHLDEALSEVLPTAGDETRDMITRLLMWGALIQSRVPSALLTATLDDAYRRGDFPSVARLVGEAKRLGVQVQPVEFASSRETAFVSKDENGTTSIRLGFNALPGWTPQLAARFLVLRDDKRPSSLADLSLMLREIGATAPQVEALVRSGACDNFGNRARHRGATLRFLQVQLSAGVNTDETSELPVEDDTLLVSRLLSTELVEYRKWEEELLGFGYTDTSSLEKLAQAVNSSPSVAAKLQSIFSVDESQVGASVLLVGLLRDIGRLEAPAATKGPPLARALLEDATGSIELVAFPPNFERHQELWQEDLPLIVTARVQKHPDGEMFLLSEHLATLNATEEEVELDVKVTQKAARKNPTAALADTEVIARPNITEANGHSGEANGNGTYSAPPPSGPTAPTPSNGSADPTLAKYRVVISIPDVSDDHEAIDAMIAVNAVLADHPGHDIVTVRIPYMGGTKHMATAQLSRTISFSERVKERLERLLSPHSLVVIELAPAG
jgi:hypothetical protein